MSETRSVLVDAWRHVASYFARQTLVRRSSAHHPHLEVVQENGKKILDGATVNYSYGGLQEVFEDVFERLAIRDRDVRGVLVLGLGAGGVVRLLRVDHAVQAPIVGVEIDPEVIAIAREHFGLGRFRNLEIVVGDAAGYVEHTTRRFDLVVVDVFVEARIPADLRAPRFVQALRDRLTPGGLLVYNQVASRPELAAEARAFATACERLLAGSAALDVRGNLVVTFERPRADSAVADAGRER